MTSRTRSSRRFATLARLLSCGLTAGLGGMPAADCRHRVGTRLDNNAALAVMNQPAYENAQWFASCGTWTPGEQLSR